MRIDSLTLTRPLWLPYVQASRRGETESRHLPLFEGTARDLPDALTHLVLTGDLQGLGEHDGRRELLGHTVARVLVDQGLLEPASTGAVLAGDLYADPAGPSVRPRTKWARCGATSPPGSGG